jgi:hypothetical protein
LDPDEELKMQKLKIFLNRISNDEEFPIEAINNLIMMKAQEYQVNVESNMSDSKMAKMFAKDETINGLCLLKCLKIDSRNNEKKLHKKIL